MIKKVVIITGIICAMVMTGCGAKSKDTGLSDKLSEVKDAAKEQEEQKEDDKKEDDKKEENVKSDDKAVIDPAEAEESLKKMSDALTGFMWTFMMSESDYNADNIENKDFEFSDEDRIRAAVLASEEDNVIDSTFALGMGGLSEDENADVGPDGDGFHGVSVSLKDVEDNCLDLFGSKASLDDLPIGPVCDIYDAVKYTDGNDTYALIIAQEIDTETSLENHECTVTEENGKYVGKVNMFWGYWGELDQKPGYSNYVVTYTLEPNDESKYGMVITSMNVKRIEGDEDADDSGSDTAAEEQKEYDEPFFGLWIAAFKERGPALDLTDKLREDGLEAYSIYSVEYENLSKDPCWCVTIGKSGSEPEAQALIEDAKKAGYKDAYVKYSGDRLSHRIYYYMYSDNGVQITPSRVTMDEIPMEELSGTAESEGPISLIIDSDTVFDKTCDMQYFPNCREGRSPLQWFNDNAEGEDIMNLRGVFEVSITGHHVDAFYGSYWWD